MKLRELPGYRALYADFAEGIEAARAFFPRTPDAANLRSRAIASQGRSYPHQELSDLLEASAREFGSDGRALANIEMLRTAQAVAVVTAVQPVLFGGPLSHWLKALTAVRLADWLREEGIPAVPVCWIEPAVRAVESNLGLLTASGPRHFRINLAPGKAGVGTAVADLLNQVALAVNSKIEDSDALQLLESAYAPSNDLALAWGLAMSRFFKGSGLILFDSRQPEVISLAARVQALPDRDRASAALAEQARRLLEAGYDCINSDATEGSGGEQGIELQAAEPVAPLALQSILLPVAAIVIGETEAYGAARDGAIFSLMGLDLPLDWPRVSATILDTRSRRVLARYGIGLEELFSGPGVLTDRLMRRLAIPETLNRIEDLKVRIDAGVIEAARAVAANEKLGAEIEKSRRRMVYQIGRLGGRYSSSLRRREEAIARQVSRLCNILAPWGQPQEKAIAGFQLTMNHQDALRRLSDSIDPWNFGHQLISL